jgi:hypothetical protein
MRTRGFGILEDSFDDFYKLLFLGDMFRVLEECERGARVRTLNTLSLSDIEPAKSSITSQPARSFDSILRSITASVSRALLFFSSS